MFPSGLHAQQLSIQPEPAGEIFAQQIIDEFVGTHPEVGAFRIFLTDRNGCRVVASTDSIFTGSECTHRERKVIDKGKIYFRKPLKKDPYYVIIRPLKDYDGNFIGGIRMDLAVTIGNREEVTDRSAILLDEFRTLIPSKKRLLEKVPE